MKNKITYWLLVAILLSGCKKYLEAKQDQSLTIPETVADYQALLDDYKTMNAQESDLAISESCADDYYLTEEQWNTLDLYLRNEYIWKGSPFYPTSSTNMAWGELYSVIYRANLVIDGIKNIGMQVGNDRNNVLGQAYFYRGRSYLRLAQLFCPVYDTSTVSESMGMPLNLSSDVNVAFVRSNLRQTFIQILSDLDMSAYLAPTVPLNKTRPSKAAAYAYLARAYLYMGVWDSAYSYSNMALNLNSFLIDYNTSSDGFSPQQEFPFSAFNNEQIHSSQAGVPSSLYAGMVDSTLYASYDTADLRRLFFWGSQQAYPFKGNYNGNGDLFAGVASDEMYLVRAESLIRLGKIKEGLDDLNYLLTKRYKYGSFLPYHDLTSEKALEILLMERRKELVFRGLRWYDIKRLSLSRQAVFLKRVLGKNVYDLKPDNAFHYALPIPQDVLAYGLPQNIGW